jgi:hypothetical protein
VLICDTSGLLALADGDDPAHRSVARAFADAESPYIISPLVLAEVDHLLRIRAGAQNTRATLRSLTTGDFEIAALSRDDLRTAIELDEQYADLRLGLTDCSLAVLAHRFRTNRLLTLDERGFRAVTPLQGGTFQLLPADHAAPR